MTHEELLETTPLQEALETPPSAQADAAAAAPPACTPAAKQAVHPVRRVGTITSGLALITGGLLLCAALFYPSLDWVALCKFAPLLLVFLGIEILVSQLFATRMRIKYDFLSVLLTLFVLGASLAAMCVPFMLEYYGPQRSTLQQTLAAEWEAELYTQLKGNEAIREVSSNVYLREMHSFSDTTTLADLSALDYTELSITLYGPYDDEAAFAAACAPVLEAVKQSSLPQPRRIFIQTPYESAPRAFSLDLSGPYQLDKTGEELAHLVEGVWYDTEDQTYYSAQEYQTRQQERAAEQQAMEEEALQNAQEAFAEDAA